MRERGEALVLPPEKAEKRERVDDRDYRGGVGKSIAELGVTVDDAEGRHVVKIPAEKVFSGQGTLDVTDPRRIPAEDEPSRPGVEPDDGKRDEGKPRVTLGNVFEIMCVRRKAPRFQFPHLPSWFHSGRSPRDSSDSPRKGGPCRIPKAPREAARAFCPKRRK